MWVSIPQVHSGASPHPHLSPCLFCLLSIFLSLSLCFSLSFSLPFCLSVSLCLDLSISVSPLSDLPPSCCWPVSPTAEKLPPCSVFQPRKDRRLSSPGELAEKPRQDSDWPDLGHMTIPNSITVAWEMGSSDWPGLGHVGAPRTREGVSSH